MAIWMEVNVGKYNAGSVKVGGSWVQTLLGGKRVFILPLLLLQNVQTGSGTHTDSCLIGTRVLS
jgi:hypothetical protein